MTQNQAKKALEYDYEVKSIIKSKNCSFMNLALKLNVSEATIISWYSGKEKPSKEQFEQLYKLPESSARGLKREDELMSIAFRHQYVPIDVLNGKVTDPDVLYYYGL